MLTKKSCQSLSDIRTNYAKLDAVLWSLHFCPLNQYALSTPGRFLGFSLSFLALAFSSGLKYCERRAL